MDVIKYMYNEQDSVQLIVKVKEVIRQRHQEMNAAKVMPSHTIHLSVCLSLCASAYQPLRLLIRLLVLLSCLSVYLFLMSICVVV